MVFLKPSCIIGNDSSVRLGLLLLNTPLAPIERLLHKVWRKAKVSIFIDGFCNEIFKTDLQTKLKPTFVTGDFDSINKKILQFYKADPLVNVRHTDDQNYTDFTKALQIVLHEYSNIESLDYIVALHSSPGTRLDHELDYFSTLYRMQPRFTVPILLLSHSVVTTVLLPGEHRIEVDPGLRSHHCGIIPLDGPAIVSTTGLKFNMDSLELRFGQLISTSNSYDDSGDVVTVKNDSPVIWTMDYDDL